MSDEPPKEDRSLVLTAVVGLVASLIPTLVIMLLVRTCDDPVKERNYKYEREKLAKATSRPEEVVPEPVAVVEDTTEAEKFLTLEEELLALAPGVYVSVRFLHESGVALTPNELKASTGVHTIEITVKSEAWDELGSEDRVDLLNNTFKFIKEHYPDMTQFLRLAYDDDRPSFDMKFGDDI